MILLLNWTLESLKRWIRERDKYGASGWGVLQQIIHNTIDDKFMYTLNYNKQNYSFFIYEFDDEQMMTERFRHC